MSTIIKFEEVKNTPIVNDNIMPREAVLAANGIYDPNVTAEQISSAIVFIKATGDKYEIEPSSKYSEETEFDKAYSMGSRAA